MESSENPKSGKEKKMKINMGLDNIQLYVGCNVQEVGGRLTLITPPEEAANIIGRNAQKIVQEIPANDRKAVVLTGPMAVWAYLIVFHAVLHAFGEVWYDDGRANKVLISKH
ncbi:hypothetical protein GYA37_03580 [candidate division WWE3 bacterium]|uniref:CRISPR-associated protein Csx3 n=1 Tax=candidate division WWE3 bacterium TaxID=2053526 RepID=A0A7X9HTY3_UNCKA|nr:hypothetical protein [candidate division WWE3 bacterium]